jgi:hypothetical protein
LTGKFPTLSGMMKLQQDNTNSVGNLSCLARNTYTEEAKDDQGQRFSFAYPKIRL